MSEIKELFKRMDEQEKVVFVELEKALELLNKVTSSGKNLKNWREHVSVALRCLYFAEYTHAKTLVALSGIVLPYIVGLKLKGTGKVASFGTESQILYLEPAEQEVFRICLNLPKYLEVSRVILKKLSETPVLSEGVFSQELQRAEFELKKTIDAVKELFVLGRRIERFL